MTVAQPPREMLEVLVDNHRRFLAFLERRVGSREAAEDILQDAFVRSLDRVDAVRDQDAIIPWFYRVLRNALTDYYRRSGAEDRALTSHAAAIADDVDPGPEQEVLDAVCACVARLVDTLKPEYAAVVKRVDLQGVSVAAFAKESGITANNAGVRLHRAHEALRRQVARSCGTCANHGCFDCSCGEPRVRR